jgi:hypothetical protein
LQENDFKAVYYEVECDVDIDTQDSEDFNVTVTRCIQRQHGVLKFSSEVRLRLCSSQSSTVPKICSSHQHLIVLVHHLLGVPGIHNSSGSVAHEAFTRALCSSLQAGPQITSKSSCCSCCSSFALNSWTPSRTFWQDSNMEIAASMSLSSPSSLASPSCWTATSAKCTASSA